MTTTEKRWYTIQEMNEERNWGVGQPLIRQVINRLTKAGIFRKPERDSREKALDGQRAFDISNLDMLDARFYLLHEGHLDGKWMSDKGSPQRALLLLAAQLGWKLEYPIEYATSAGQMELSLPPRKVWEHVKRERQSKQEEG